MKEGSTLFDKQEIIKVEFYSNQIKIGEDLSSPYQFIWTNPPIGSHNITSRRNKTSKQ